MRKKRYSLPTIAEIHASSQIGQALIEFALILPLLLLLIFGVLEFGRAFQIKIVMENAAREGAHFFIYDKDDITDDSLYADYFSETQQAVITEAANSGVTITDAEITVECLDGGVAVVPPATCPSGSTVDVTVTNQFEVAVINFLLPEFTMHSNARMFVP
jgi:Flp pilus assembly protein TadG